MTTTFRKCLDLGAIGEHWADVVYTADRKMNEQDRDSGPAWDVDIKYIFTKLTASSPLVDIRETASEWLIEDLIAEIIQRECTPV